MEQGMSHSAGFTLAGVGTALGGDPEGIVDTFAMLGNRIASSLPHARSPRATQAEPSMLGS